MNQNQNIKWEHLLISDDFIKAFNSTDDTGNNGHEHERAFDGYELGWQEPVRYVIYNIGDRCGDHKLSYNTVTKRFKFEYMQEN